MRKDSTKKGWKGECEASEQAGAGKGVEELRGVGGGKRPQMENALQNGKESELIPCNGKTGWNENSAKTNLN